MKYIIFFILLNVCFTNATIVRVSSIGQSIYINGFRYRESISKTNNTQFVFEVSEEQLNKFYITSESNSVQIEKYDGTMEQSYNRDRLTMSYSQSKNINYFNIKNSNIVWIAYNNNFYGDVLFTIKVNNKMIWDGKDSSLFIKHVDDNIMSVSIDVTCFSEECCSYPDVHNGYYQTRKTWIWYKNFDNSTLHHNEYINDNLHDTQFNIEYIYKWK